MKFENLVNEYKKIKLKIRRTEIQELELRELKGFPASVGRNGMPASKQNTSAVENMMLKLDEILKERQLLQNRLLNIREKISTLIDLISNAISQSVVEMKVFIQNCGWKYISSQCGFSESYCRRLYRDGVQEINERLDLNDEI